MSEENVLRMKKEEIETTNQKVEKFIMKNRKGILGVICAAVIAGVGFGVSVAVRDAQVKKDLNALDIAEFNFTNKSADIDEKEVSERCEAALKAVVPYLSKKNVAGVRANMLAAEVSFIKKDLLNAEKYAVAAAEADKKAYTSALCWFNAASYCEELGKTENALAYYNNALATEDFYLASHALFSIARINEVTGNVKEAEANYRKIIDNYTNDWASLAQSRLISLKAAGKID